MCINIKDNNKIDICVLAMNLRNTNYFINIFKVSCVPLLNPISSPFSQSNYNLQFLASLFTTYASILEQNILVLKNCILIDFYCMNASLTFLAQHCIYKICLCCLAADQSFSLLCYFVM